MKNIDFKKVLPHLLAVGVMYLVAIIFCLPTFQGMAVPQSDMMQAAGAIQQSNEFLAANGHYPLWTNSMFAGMPTFTLMFGTTHGIDLGILRTISTGFLPEPASMFFAATLCFYILTQSAKIKPWIGILGALCYAYATYNVIIVEVGHITKMYALAYFPLALAGMVLLFNKRYITGLLTSTIGSYLLLMANHSQMTYYFLIIVICFAIVLLTKVILNKDFGHLAKVAIVGIVAAVLGVMCFSGIFLITKEYANETMRGGRSELTLDAKTPEEKANKSKGGFDKDYAFAWSSGKLETFTAILPNFMGSHSAAEPLGTSSKVAEAAADAGLPEQVAASMSAYWGAQPFTSGPSYFGGIICLLFVASFFFVDKRYIIWLGAATLIAIILSWGKNFASFNYYIFDHLPYYNKFRAPASVMVIPQLTIVFLATLCIHQIGYSNLANDIFAKQVKKAGIAVASVLALLLCFYLFLDFTPDNSKEFKEQLTTGLTNMYAQGKQPTAEMVRKAEADVTTLNIALIKDRAKIYMNDFLRLLLLTILAAAVVYYGMLKNMLKPMVGTLLIALLAFVDVFNVGYRYLNKEKFVPKEDIEGQVSTASNADLIIKKDTSFFRVFDQTASSPFESAKASHFHNSVGGYSPAKLGLYQDLVKFQLSKGNMAAYNMLNVKYIITQNPQNGTPMVQPNTQACGNAWFVKELKYVKSADEEMLALDSLDVNNVAVLQNTEKALVKYPPSTDTSAKIRLVKNMNDDIEYKSSSIKDGFAVFSEIYYTPGWTAQIDGKDAPIVKVNYLLRGLSIPAGTHKITFKFMPKTYELGNTVSKYGGIITILVILACLVLLLKDLFLPKKSEVAID